MCPFGVDPKVNLRVPAFLGHIHRTIGSYGIHICNPTIADPMLKLMIVFVVRVPFAEIIFYPLADILSARTIEVGVNIKVKLQLNIIKIFK